MSINSVTSNSTYYQSIIATAKISNSSVVASASTNDTTPIDTTTTTVSTSTDTPNFNISTKWGFNVDKDGYFGVDFNKAAGLPENMKINQKMMEKAQEYSNARGDNIDPLTIVSKIFNLYKSVAGNTFDPEGTGFMSEAEVEKMPYSYVSKGSLLDGIVSVQGTFDECMKAEDTDCHVSMATNLSTGIREFVGMWQYSDTSFIASSKETCEQINGVKTETSGDDSKISTGEMFSIFFYSQTAGETYSINQEKSSSGEHKSLISRTQEYYKFLQSGQSIKDYMSNTMTQEQIDYLKKGLGTKPNGTFDPNMVDTFFDNLEKEVAQSRAEYQANNYPSLDSTPTKSTDNSPLSQLSKAYQSSTNSSKLTSGSLMSTSA